VCLTLCRSHAESGSRQTRQADRQAGRQAGRQTRQALRPGQCSSTEGSLRLHLYAPISTLITLPRLCSGIHSITIHQTKVSGAKSCTGTWAPRSLIRHAIALVFAVPSTFLYSYGTMISDQFHQSANCRIHFALDQLKNEKQHISSPFRKELALSGLRKIPSNRPFIQLLVSREALVHAKSFLCKLAYLEPLGNLVSCQTGHKRVVGAWDQEERSTYFKPRQKHWSGRSNNTLLTGLYQCRRPVKFDGVCTKEALLGSSREN